MVFKIIFWLALSFMVADYTLARARVTDPLRVAIAVGFAILFVVFGIEMQILPE